MTLRLNEHGPADPRRRKALFRTTGDSNEFGRHRAVEVRSPELLCPLEEPSLFRMIPSSTRAAQWQEVGETRVGMTIFGKVHLAERSGVEVAGNAQMSARHRQMRDRAGGQDGGHVAK